MVSAFDVSDRSSALKEARLSAMSDAQKQAEALAEASGVKLGKVTSISVSMSSPPVPMYNMYGGMGGGGGMDAAAPAPISGGQLTVSVDIYVTYEIVK